MEDSVTPEQSIMLCMATLYVAITEAVNEMFGKDIEPLINHHIEQAMLHLPEDAANLCDYLLQFSSSSHALPQSSGGLFGELTIHRSARARFDRFKYFSIFNLKGIEPMTAYLSQPASRLGRSIVTQIATAQTNASQFTTNFSAQTYVIRILSTLPIWATIGSTAVVTANSASVNIPANVPEYFAVTSGQVLNFISTSTSTGYVTFSECV